MKSFAWKHSWVLKMRFIAKDFSLASAAITKTSKFFATTRWLSYLSYLLISHESLVVSNPVKIAVDNYKITNIILSFSSWKYNTSRKIYASLRDKDFGGAVLMNLSMANNTLNHDLLTTKLHVYGHRMWYLNPIQDGLFQGCSGMGDGAKRPPLPKICHANLAQLYLI